MSWNLRGAAKPRLDAVVDLVQAHEPDVVALQEVRTGQARRLAGLLRWRRPAWSLKHNAYWPVWWLGRGPGRALAPPPGRPPRRGPHPGISRRTFRRRILLPVEVVLEDDQRVLLIDAHLSSGAEDEERRAGQAHHIVAILPDAVPVIVAGDLNADPDRGAIAKLLARRPRRRVGRPRGAGPGFTIPANAPRRRIDYVLVGAGMVEARWSTISARR